MAGLVSLLTGRAGLALLACLTGFLAAWSWQGARWDADVAATRAIQAHALAQANQRVLEMERAAQAQARALEDAHVQMSELRTARAGEIERLSDELGRAVERLRRVGADRDRTGLSGASAAACGCEELRAARDRLAGALERIVAGGGGIVADGQRAVDVATLAARAAHAASQTVKEGAP